MSKQKYPVLLANYAIEVGLSNKTQLILAIDIGSVLWYHLKGEQQASEDSRESI